MDPVLVWAVGGMGTAILGLSGVLYRELRNQITARTTERDEALVLLKGQTDATKELTAVVREAITPARRTTR